MQRLPALLMSAVTTAASAATPDTPAIVAAAQAAAAAELGRAAVLGAPDVRRADGWSFLRAELQGGNGRPFDYAGTPLEEPAREGYVSRSYVALLARRDDGRWHVVEQRIGPTDVAWAGWAAKHHAPASLFATP